MVDIVYLDVVVQQDLIWWASFTQWFNGRARVLGAGNEESQVFTDSSNYGFGGHVEDDYFWGVCMSEGGGGSAPTGSGHHRRRTRIISTLQNYGLWWLLFIGGESGGEI